MASKAKRLVDVLGAVVGLAIAAPIGFFIAIAIKIEDRGPILYWQTRCGLYGKTFRMGKFRSMIVDADRKKHLVSNQAKGFIFKNDRDPRITRVGRFIRKTSLDELPQLWNVLQGEMSLVGTRPPTPDEACQYELHHWQRLRVKPGITGEWQVNGRSRVEDFEDIVKLDLAYQEKWSFWYDLYIIWKTIWVVLRVDGAY
ncbi:MAG: sugar transferase [Elainellaceae cyanobacterium]